MHNLIIRSIESGDRDWINIFIKNRWHGHTIIAHGVVYMPKTLPGCIALAGGEPCGLITYHIENSECEYVFLGI